MRSKDPIKKFQQHLQERGIWSDEDESEAKKTTLGQVKAAIARAEKVPQPGVRSIFEDVYSEQTWNLRAEADELSEETGGD
jgi:2-oxoisovalerate dehydrogenase E1 component alpha subunit